MASPSPLCVLLYVPNLIGYVRVLSGLIGLHKADSPAWFLPLYTLSSFLDLVDGLAARSLNQSSMFGAVLDMVTDRCITSGLLLYLSHLGHPYIGQWAVSLSVVFISLDVSSHYMQMYATLKKGAMSHKTTRANSFPLFRMYYESRYVLCAVCAGDQLFWISLYALLSPKLAGLSYTIAKYAAVIAAPVCLLKQFLNVVQLCESSMELAAMDVSKSKS